MRVVKDRRAVGHVGGVPANVIHRERSGDDVNRDLGAFAVCNKDGFSDEHTDSCLGQVQFGPAEVGVDAASRDAGCTLF